MRNILNVTYATGTGNIATYNELMETSNDAFPWFELIGITCHFSTGTSNDITITLDSKQGSAYDTVLKTITCSSTTDAWWYLEEPQPFKLSDRIKVTWTNDASYTYGLRILTMEG